MVLHDFNSYQKRQGIDLSTKNVDNHPLEFSHGTSESTAEHVFCIFKLKGAILLSIKPSGKQQPEFGEQDVSAKSQQAVLGNTSIARESSTMRLYGG